MKKRNILFLAIAVISFTACDEDATTPMAKEQTGPLTATWVNIDKETSNITRVSISSSDGVLSIEMWGACEPEDCDWGVVKTSISDAQDSTVSVQWDHEFAIRDQVIHLNEAGQLEVDTHTKFTDDSGRGERDNYDIFEREG